MLESCIEGLCRRAVRELLDCAAVLCGELYLCVPPRIALRLQGPLLFMEEASADAMKRVYERTERSLLRLGLLAKFASVLQR